MTRSFAPFLALLAVACGTSGGTPTHHDPGADAGPESLDFPSSFLLGSSIAGFQVDMGCPTLKADVCEDKGSDWYQFVTDPKTVGDSKAHVSGQPPSVGP